MNAVVVKKATTLTLGALILPAGSKVVQAVRKGGVWVVSYV